MRRTALATVLVRSCIRFTAEPITWRSCESSFISTQLRASTISSTARDEKLRNRSFSVANHGAGKEGLAAS